MAEYFKIAVFVLLGLAALTFVLFLVARMRLPQRVHCWVVRLAVATIYLYCAFTLALPLAVVWGIFKYLSK